MPWLTRFLGNSLNGGMRHPAYTAFRIVRLNDEPWAPQLPTHDKAAEDWTSRTAGSRPSQDISFQAYLLYSLRFILAAHMCAAWENFGGIPAKINALGAHVNISIVGNSGISIAYDILLRKHLPTLARQRKSDADFFVHLSLEVQEIKNQVYADRNAWGEFGWVSFAPLSGGRKGNGNI